MAGISTCVISWENFVEIHTPQLQHIGLPPHLWKELYEKLSPIIRKDASNNFERRKQQENNQKNWALHAKKELKKDEDVFIIEHAWTSDGAAGAKKKLENTPELLFRLQGIMGLSETDDHGNQDTPQCIESCTVIKQVSGVTEEKAQECLDLSGNDLIDALTYAEGGEPPKVLGNEKADKGVLSFEEFKWGFKDSVEPEQYESLSEEFLKKIYKKYLADNESENAGVQYGGATTTKYTWEENSEEGAITVLVSVPKTAKKATIVNKLTAKHWRFGLKGCEPIIDGEFYAHILPDECFWTFDSPGVVQMTLQKRGTDEGMWPACIKGETQFSVNQIYKQAKEKQNDKLYNLATTLNAMWYYNQTYQKVTVQGGPQEHCWYVMDEIASAITHSNTPNIKCSPFAYAVNGMTCSLIWPIQNIKQGEICTRNFCPKLMPIETDKQLEARQMACSYEMPLVHPRSFLEDYADAAASLNKSSPKVLIAPLGTDTGMEDASQEMKLSLKFYVEEGSKDIKGLLEGLGCSVVAKAEEADAQWLEQSKGVFTREQKTNRLSGEDILLRRDMIGRMLQKKLGQVKWFPKTYNLRSQLPALCADHYMNGVSSIWLVRSVNPLQSKPVVTTDLRRVIRLGETGSLVASHFCISTALFHKKTVCLQYTVTVPSLSPLELHIHNTPRFRHASKQLDPMQELDEYDSLAVITVDDGKPQDESFLKEFTGQLKKYYLIGGRTTWEEVQKMIFQRIGELFYTLSSSLSPMGGSNQSSDNLSAVFGVDVLLQESLEPVIIGVNATPSFANDQVGKDVLYLAFGEHDKKETLPASRNVTKVTFEN